MTICISGSTGFLGKTFLKRNKKTHIVSFNKKNKNYFNILSKKKGGEDKLKFFLEKEKIKTFIHFGWSNVTKPDSILHIKYNLYHFKKLYKICAGSNVNKFINIGSIDEYSNKSGIVNEGSKINIKFLNNYARAKYLSLKYMMEHSKKTKMKFIHIRLGNVYGFKKNKNYLINKLFLNSKKQQIILGDISQVRSYIYVKKAALIIKNMINKFDNKIVNLGNYRTLSIEDFIKKYTKIANFKIKIISSKKKSEYFKYHSKYINTHNDNFYINFKEIFIQQKKLLQNV